MVACPGARTALLALLVLVPLAPIGVGLPHTIAPGPHTPLDAAALHVLSARLSVDGAINPVLGQNETLFVRDQMIGVLAYLHAAEIQPTRETELRANALELWRIARSYNHSADYYYVDLRTSNPCVDLETNAWGLIAAMEVARAFGDEALDATVRVEEVGATLAAIVNDGAASPVCDPGYRAHALALWALVILAGQGDQDEAARAVRSGLDSLMASGFDAAFYGDNGVHDVVANARLLVVLDGAARALAEPRYAQARDTLTDFLVAHMARAEARDTVARSVTRNDPETATGPLGPWEQMWLAYALDLASAATGQGAAERDALLATLVRRWWDPGRQGGMIDEAGRLQAHLNALAAVFFSSPSLSREAVERSEVSVAIRALESAQYPSPQASDASRWLMVNEHERRISVTTTSDGPTVTYWPGSALGSYDFSFPVTPFYPAPSFVRVSDGTAMPVTVDGSGFLKTTKQGAGTTEYLVKAYLPIDPLDYAYGGSITLRLRNQFVEPLTLPRLVLETEAADVTFQSVTVNGPSPVQFQAIEVPPNVFLDDRHTRLVLSDITLRPGVNTVAIGFEDLVGPQIAEFGLFEDRALLKPMASDSDGVYTLLTNQPMWVGARADDNTRVKQVNLVVRRPGGDAPQTFAFEPADDRPGWARAQVRIQETGTATFEVVAQDVKDNFSPTETARADVRSSILAGSSIVLFVFAAVLFIATAFIWLKIRRRHG